MLCSIINSLVCESQASIEDNLITKRISAKCLLLAKKNDCLSVLLCCFTCFWAKLVVCVFLECLFCWSFWGYDCGKERNLCVGWGWAINMQIMLCWFNYSVLRKCQCNDEFSLCYASQQHHTLCSNLFLFPYHKKLHLACLLNFFSR